MTSLPPLWCYGPALEMRLRFRPRLKNIDELELSRRLDAIGVSGPLQLDRLTAIARRRSLQRGDLAVADQWRPRSLVCGVWMMAQHWV